jgi:hypothetical protein
MPSIIEWPGSPNSSAMSMEVLDTAGTNPQNVIDSGVPFTVKVKWTVPQGFAQTLGGSFRLRVYAESIGPGQEIQIGATTIVPVAPVPAPSSAFYDQSISIPAGLLLGEGELFGGVPVSGTYKLVAVLQHLNPIATEVSGYAENDGMLFIRTP